MNKDKISSQEIIDLVATKASVSKRAAEEFLKVMIATIEDALLAGDVVKIKNFGTFKLQWNEPRKSVNVQTGEDILIEGYHKVSFTPDSTLKELINEPFAHLQPVQLDGDVEQKVETVDEDIPEPLRIFTEQASEIKNLISEINALSPKPIQAEPKAKIEKEIEEEPEMDIEDEDDLLPIEEDVEIDEHEVESLINDEEKEENEEKGQIEEKIIEDYEFEQTEKENADYFEIKDEETTIEPVSIEETESEPVIETVPEISNKPVVEKVKPLKRKSRRKSLRVILILFLILFSVTSLYVLFPPATNLGDKAVAKLELIYIDIRNNFSVTHMLNDVTKWVTPKPEKLSKVETVVIPKDSIVSDSLSTEQPIDSLQILFDTPRVYPEFIASERIVQGSRLARMSQRYYGTSDFWVYIYEANMDRFDDPDQIPTGSLIRIPKLDPRLIDASNPRCINKAKELHDLYVKRPQKQ